jgi:hypothetical protein
VSDRPAAHVEVDIPAAMPSPGVSYVSVPGWDTDVVTETLPRPIGVDETRPTEVVTQLIWTARPGSEITGDEIRRFAVSVLALRRRVGV